MFDNFTRQELRTLVSTLQSACRELRRECNLTTGEIYKLNRNMLVEVRTIKREAMKKLYSVNFKAA